MNTLSDFRELINAIIDEKDISSKKKFIKLYSVFKDHLSILLVDEKQYFPSKFSELIYLLDKFGISEDSQNIIKKYFYSLKKALRLKSEDFSEENLNKALNQINFIIDTFYKLDSVQIREPERDLYKKNSIVTFKNVIVSRKVKVGISTKGNNYAELKINAEETEINKLILLEPWVYVFDLVEVNDEINLINVRISREGKNISLLAGFDSIVVIEPDYLIDVTDISECFQISGPEFRLYFIKRFLRSVPGISMLKGNLVNSFFDDIISNPEIDYENAYEHAIKGSPLQLFSLAYSNPVATKSLKGELEIHFLNLKNQISEFFNGIISVEPSFISPDYGIQGRLDAMIEFEDEILRKNVIELKSGNPPDVNIVAKTSDGRVVRTGVWPNHLAQTSCYNLLLKSAFENRSGISSILYSSAFSDQLRNVPDINQIINEIIHCRNNIAAYEKKLSKGDFSILDNIIESHDIGIPRYMSEDFDNFKKVYNSFEIVEMSYFRLFISFIINEIFASKTGSEGVSRANGFSSLWKDEKFEKEMKGRIIPNLLLRREESDFKQMHFVFSHNIGRSNNSSFRTGDIVILYPDSDDQEIKPYKMQLLKGHIKDFSPDTITVSLRNKLINTRLIKDHDKWVIEFDSMDTTNKKLLALIFGFLSSPSQKKELIFGIRKPEVNNIDYDIIDEGLNTEQREILIKALRSEDYFLIQGPPGTGKTSYMLRSVVENIHHNTAENILILAYTNRAVDEICNAIKNSELTPDFLRMGSKESTVHIENLLYWIIEIEGIREAYNKFINCRIIISTISSIIYNKEILAIKNFDTVIIDEASQILEPQLVGILSSIKRFIMIGDDKQLPAVVVQNKPNVSPDLYLKSIFLEDPRISLFERLLTNAKANKWVGSYGMLKRQARMHKGIMEFPNMHFYENKLEIFTENIWQKEKYSYFKPNSDNKLIENLSKSRVIFIESEIDKKLKVSQDEVKKAIDLLNIINEISKIESGDKVGIISPYRMQCSEILHSIPKEYAEFVDVDTVERFQGSERDIIIYSFATNNGILLDMNVSGNNIDKKLNVAMTRSKKHLLILGNPRVLKAVPIFNELIEYIKSKSGYISSKDYKDSFTVK